MHRCSRNRQTLLIVALLAIMVVLSVVAIAAVPNWPRQIDASGAKIVVYQPQPEKLTGDKLSARAALKVTPKGQKTALYGTAWFNAKVSTNRDTRVSAIHNVKVTKVIFPNIPAKRTVKETKLVQNSLPKADLTMSMDSLMVCLHAAQAGDDPNDLSTTPPQIIFVNYRAVLVTLDGQPVLSPVQGTRLRRVVNTPFFIVQNSAGTNYLYGGGTWYSSNDILAGPWRAGATPPSEVMSVFRKSQVNSVTPANGTPPRVVIATTPTELISSNGAPVYSKAVDDELLYMSNTDRDVFQTPADGTYYVLLSGRWYSSQSLDGPWTYVASDQLPASFADIPSDSPKANVLASVAGTQPAEDALADAEIPQTAEIRRDAPGPNVTYDGDPQFDPIRDTDMSYAVNTNFQVLDYGNTYYCCYQGVWYDSTSPNGPWVVATSIPAEFSNIPPNYPVYNTRYCSIYSYTPDYVSVGYTPGYYGCYAYGPTVVYGTGFYYPGWWHHRFFPRPWTWGFGVGYVPWTGDWAFGIGFGAGWFNFGFGWGFDWDDWFGPLGFFDFDFDFRHHRFDRDHRRFRERDRDIFNRSENRDRLARRPEERNLRAGRFARGEQNNVFSNRRGQVFRRTPQGWQQRQGNTWSRPVPSTRFPGRVTGGNRGGTIPRGTTPRVGPSFPRNTAPMHPMEPDFQARQRGQERTNNFGRVFGGPSGGGASVPRGGGGRSGGFSGGGGGRSSGSFSGGGRGGGFGGGGGRGR